ncbi:MAG: hypothetical protein J5I98_22265 [Phaeodactylibacter sp.]|nr:hypothetical protein [Phaeodactylibacter sp.]
MKTITRMKYVMFPLALAGLLFTASCNKDDENSTPDKTGLLTAHSWVLQDLTVSPAYDWFGDGSPITDIYALFPVCAQDDYTTFHRDGKAAFNEGAKKCFASDPQERTGTWAWQDGETAVSVTENGETEKWKVTKLTATELVAEFAVIEEGVTYTFTSSYRKK